MERQVPRHVRDFWKATAGTRREFRLRAHRLGDLYAATAAARGRASTSSPRTTASRCNDLVSYNDKHNEANGEDNRDGTTTTARGTAAPRARPTTRHQLTLRERQQRNCSPRCCSRRARRCSRRRRVRPHAAGQQQRLLPGQRDLLVDWPAADGELLAFTAELIALRRQHPAFRRAGWYRSAPGEGEPPRSLTWFHLDGREMHGDDIDAEPHGALAMRLDGGASAEPGADGQPVGDAVFYLAWNSGAEPLACTLPGGVEGGGPGDGEANGQGGGEGGGEGEGQGGGQGAAAAVTWRLVLDTATGEAHASGAGAATAGGEAREIAARSLAVFRADAG
jgi:isoamylase